MLRRINDSFERVIITCHNNYHCYSFELEELSSYSVAKFYNLGNYKREELIKKWVSIGVEETICDEELYTQCDSLKQHLDTVIKKNIVPSRPIYVLMILQMFEATAKQNIELTSYGHCYQSFIYKSFEDNDISFSSYEELLNVLTELSWAMHKNKGVLNYHMLDLFCESYEEEYIISDLRKSIDILCNCSLIEKNKKSIGLNTHIFITSSLLRN